MKKKKFLGVICAIFSLLLVGCEYVAYVAVDVLETDPVAVENNSRIMLRSAQGYNSSVGTVYVQQGVGTGLKVQSKTSLSVKSAKWVIGMSEMNGVEIFYKFETLGEITLSVVVTFADNTTETRSFIVVSVLDISKADPIQYFATDNGNNTWTVLILVSAERLKMATDTAMFYNGLVSNWVLRAIPSAGRNYNITTDGKPQVVTGVGKYIGTKIVLGVAGLYNIAFIHSVDNWADLSGSSYIRKENQGLAWFYFERGTISPRGDGYIGGSLPGSTSVVGDSYFRHEEKDTSFTLYFKLDEVFTANAFVVKERAGGTYSAPILMTAVSGFPEWGKIDVPASELIGIVAGFRYGPNKATPTIFSKNMEYSICWDEYFKNLRLLVLKI